MSLDIVDLREFYISPLGRAVRGLLRARLSRIWPEVKGETILTLGYGTPFMRPWLGKAAALWAMMPAAQGVAFWPREGPNLSCLADLENLPLPDESVSRIVAVHALEVAADPESLLRETWRVLQPNGRALVIVPNRRGFWAHDDRTPFGTGQPYSFGQLRSLLRDQGFLVERSWHALYAPPGRSLLAHSLARLVEKIIPSSCTAFGGLLVMEASKQIYAPTLVKARAAGRRLVVPLPFATPPGPVGARRER